jgi:hypothetical protein
VVTFGGLPLPGATVTATQGLKVESVVTDDNGAFQFEDLGDGRWIIDIEMQCFAPVHAEVIVAPNSPAGAYELKLLDSGQIQAFARPARPAAETTATVEASKLPQAETTKPAQNDTKPAQNDTKPAQNNAQVGLQEVPTAPVDSEQSADGFLVLGSVNNGATSPYSTNPAFGNMRPGSKAFYTGGFTAYENNSALNAQPYALSGQPASKPAYNDFTAAAWLLGPIGRHGPNFSLSYQWTRNSNSAVLVGLVPTAAERTGDLAGLKNPQGQPVTVYQPGTNTPYPGNKVPVSAQAAALLALYPQANPNIPAASGYNYQATVLNVVHQDSLQSRFDQNLGHKDSLNGSFVFQSTRSDSVNLFGFVDPRTALGTNASIQWEHRFTPNILVSTKYSFSRLSTDGGSNFAYRENVSGQAGIPAGSLNNLKAPGSLQDPADWGPPSLSFSSGLASLRDANSSFNRSRTDTFSASMLIHRNKHTIEAGGEFRKAQYNYEYQQNPRGSFVFTGAATAGTQSSPASGSDLADFLIGVPDTESIAYGNRNKYFREPVFSAHINDEWRVKSTLTINAGIRWDYTAPITELSGNLVNLDASTGFTAVAPVVASDPVGSVTGKRYPASLIRPERDIIEPRIGVAWRPNPASTMVIRAGYGVYADTSVYQNIILNLAQQAPLSKSFVVQNSSACPLTLANGFAPCAAVIGNTFGIDPNFRIGYAQNWQLSVQRDLPFALQGTATYSGIKGTHGPQEILPNSYPLGTANPCPSCPSGFVYETSNGNSIREAGQFQLRRRLGSGFGWNLAYTFAKSIDDDAYLGGLGHLSASPGGQAPSASLSFPAASLAQNWLDPHAERSRSNFDQRHVLSLQTQYTSGEGLRGGTLLGGWRGRALKEWTVACNLVYGSGLPESPLYPAPVPGTGFSSVLRPDLTGAPIYISGTGAHLNRMAYSEPLGGWGTAGRNSIDGPNRFTFNTSLSRTFRPHGKWYLDVAVNATNILNHPAFVSWSNIVTSNQFGLPTAAGQMRSLQTSFHLRWQ